MKQTIFRLLLYAALMAPLLFPPACRPEKKPDSPSGRITRIVSLSPSISREIADLGAGDLLAGVTSYDDMRGGGIEVVGTLVQPNLEKILELRPDIVLYSVEDGLVQNIGRISGAGVPAFRFGRNTDFSDISRNYLILAGMLDRTDNGRVNIKRYHAALERLRKRNRAETPPCVVFLVSCRPLIAASADSFIGKIINDAGGRCAFDVRGRAHPLVSLESLVKTDPDVICAMTGGDDIPDFFRQLSRDFMTLKAVSGGRMYEIPADTIPYYTPADYVKSVEMVSRILHNISGAR